jgi:hypothetical protein
MMILIERLCDIILFSILKNVAKVPYLTTTEQDGTGKLFCDAGVAESAVL